MLKTTINAFRTFTHKLLYWLKSVSPKRANLQSGFTLAELVASTSIIIVTSGGFALFMMNSAETQRTSKERSAAEKVMHSEMEKLYAQPFDALVASWAADLDNFGEENLLYTINPSSQYGKLVQCTTKPGQDGNGETITVPVQIPSVQDIATALEASDSQRIPEIRKIALTRTGSQVVTKDVEIYRTVDWEITNSSGENTYEPVTCANKNQGGLKRLIVRVEWETKRGKAVSSLVSYRSVHVES